MESISDIDLLTAIMGGTEGHRALAQELLEGSNGSLLELTTSDMMQFRMDRRINAQSLRKLKLAIELARRTTHRGAAAKEQCLISSAKDIADIFRPLIINLKHEECWIVYLTAYNRLVEYRKVGTSGIASVVLDKRVIIKRAIELLSPQFIMVHNHPSGCTTPSQDDIELTRTLKQEAAAHNINLVDHLVLTDTAEFSFFQNDLL